MRAGPNAAAHADQVDEIAATLDLPFGVQPAGNRIVTSIPSAVVALDRLRTDNSAVTSEADDARVIRLVTEERLPRPAPVADRPSENPGAVITVEQELGLLALALRRGLDRRSRRPQRWSAAAFVREVELVRLHLAPILSRALLTASYGREACRGRPAPLIGSRASKLDGAVQVAYGLRWLELDGEDRQALPSWPTLLGLE